MPDPTSFCLLDTMRSFEVTSIVRLPVHLALRVSSTEQLSQNPSQSQSCECSACLIRTERQHSSPFGSS